MNAHKVMLVEDDRDIRELIQMQLESMGQRVVSCRNGEEASEHLSNGNDFSLYILDWMLPGRNGIELCRSIRQQNRSAQTPILMVTAKSTSEDIIHGLESGADDYITKPFDVEVLRARVKALLRRFDRLKGEVEEVSTMNFGRLKVDKRQVKIWVEDTEVHLTHSEYQILLQLMEDPGTVYSRRELYEKIQGPDTFATERTIDTHIAGLRKKLLSEAKLIETIRGVGYRFLAE